MSQRSSNSMVCDRVTDDVAVATEELFPTSWMMTVAPRCAALSFAMRSQLAGEHAYVMGRICIAVGS